MSEIFMASVATLCLIFVNIVIIQISPKWWLYPLFFFVVFFSSFFFKQKVEAAQIFIPNHEIEARFFNHEAALTPTEQIYYSDKRDFHKKNAEIYYKKAKNTCSWFPNYSDQELARQLFTSTITAGLSAASGLGVTGAGIAALTTLIAQYSLDTYDHWNSMRKNLELSKYHYEQYLFFKNVVEKA